MSFKDAKARVREMAVEEDREAADLEARVEGRLRKWRRTSVLLCTAWVISILSIIPFLAGFPLHGWWDSLGKRILLLAGVLLLVSFYVGGTTYNFWLYLRDIKKTHRSSPPPGSRFRKPESKPGGTGAA
jgi:hypothetical protein